MNAARFHAREDVRIDDIPEPETTEGAVEIKVDWCGICGTDLHEYLEGPIFTPVAGSPHSPPVRSPRSSSVTSSPGTSPRSARGDRVAAKGAQRGRPQSFAFGTEGHSRWCSQENSAATTKSFSRTWCETWNSRCTTPTSSGVNTCVL